MPKNFTELCSFFFAAFSQSANLSLRRPSIETEQIKLEKKREREHEINCIATRTTEVPMNDVLCVIIIFSKEDRRQNVNFVLIGCK